MDEMTSQSLPAEEAREEGSDQVVPGEEGMEEASDQEAPEERAVIRQEVSEKDVEFLKLPDEASMRRRRRRALLIGVIITLSVAALFCCFISTLVGVPQSFIGQWWMAPPRYPDAVQVNYTEDEVCLPFQPGTYCHEWYYRTDDTVEQVIAYYENLDWLLHGDIKFEWRRGRRFGLNWVTEECVYILSNIACYQIIVRPSPDEQGNTEVYILERGAMGHIRSSDR